MTDQPTSHASASPSEKQLCFLRGVWRAHYPTLSASEAGDDDIIALLDSKEYVDTYWGIGGTHLKLTDAGMALLGVSYVTI